MTTQTNKRTKYQHHFRYKTDFSQTNSNGDVKCINTFKNVHGKQSNQAGNALGFCLPSIFHGINANQQKESQKTPKSNTKEENRLSTQRSNKNGLLKDKMMITKNNYQKENLNERQSNICFRQSKFFQNKSNRQTFIYSPRQFSLRKSILGEESFLSSLSSNRASYIRQYAILRGPSKYLKGKQLIDSSSFILEPLSEEGIKMLKGDVSKMKKIFSSNSIYDSQFCIYRSYYSDISQEIGKLLFFMGIQIVYGIQKDMLGQEWLEKMRRCLHYQIYYSLHLKVYPIALESLIQCSRLYSTQKQYDTSEYFCEIALKIAVRQSNQYYEQTALQQISYCQYKLGNIDEAKSLHDNVSKISFQSRGQILKSFNQAKYLTTLREYLFYGTELNTQRNVRLVQTIGFNKTGKAKTEEQTKKMIIPVIDRLAASKTNRSIHEFRKSQQKVNDMRKQSNQKAIKSIRLKHLHKIQEEMRDNGNLKYSDPNQSGLEMNNMYSLRQYETLNRSQVRKVSTNFEESEKNMRIFRSFLQFVQKMIENDSIFGNRHS